MSSAAEKIATYEDVLAALVASWATCATTSGGWTTPSIVLGACASAVAPVRAPTSTSPATGSSSKACPGPLTQPPRWRPSAPTSLTVSTSHELSSYWPPSPDHS